MNVFGDLEDNSPSSGLWGADEEQPPKWDAPAGPPQPQPQSQPQSQQQQQQPHQQQPQQHDVNEPYDPHKVPAPLVKKKEKRERLTVRISKYEKTNNDNNPLYWFDVVTTLPRFRTTTFRDVRRTHAEIKRFASHLASANPECFVPALPCVRRLHTDSSGFTHDDKIVESVQRWFDRITRNPLLARDEEFLYFVEASFGYTPVVKIRAPATGLARKMIKQFAVPEDHVTELVELRPLVKLVYMLSLESRDRVTRVSKSRQALATAMRDLSAKAKQYLQCEQRKGMVNLWSNFSQKLEKISHVEGFKSNLELAIYADGIEQVGQDAYLIKETLTNRHILMRDLAKAQNTSRLKHQTATRLKGESSISPAKVDEAIHQLEEASSLERKITGAVRRVTDNLVVERRVALARIEEDVLDFIGRYTLRFIECDRRSLRLWEELRPDLRVIDKDGDIVMSKTQKGPRRYRVPHSQTITGDSWSGDRDKRARDIHMPVKPSDEIVDAKSAARVLSESVM